MDKRLYELNRDYLSYGCDHVPTINSRCPYLTRCENTPTAARYLTTLIELGIVEKTAPFFSRAPEKSRNHRYRISDHYIRFWYRFVLPNQTAIRSLSGKAVVKNGVIPFLDDFMGDAFESLCRDFLVYFSKELRKASKRGEVMLIGPDELIKEKR